MDDIAFTNRMQKFTGQKYFLGDPGRGWDCINSLRDFFESSGISLPDEFDGWTWENYPSKWNGDMKEGCRVLKRFVLSLGSPIGFNYLLPGDLLLFERDWMVSVGIYLGNGIFQAASKPHGIIRMPLRYFKAYIVAIRRLTA